MIEITELDHSGRGIGRLNNKIVFVENALPNEVVNIRITNEKKKFIEANVDSYIKLATNRIESPCPYFESCGGCDLLHLNYNDQLKFKQNKIKNIITRYLNCDIKINNIIGSENNFNYRNKTTFQINGDIGFFKKKSYDIIPIDKCLISDNLINNAIKYLKKLNLKYITKIICRSSNSELMIIIESSKSNINIEPIRNIAASIYIKNNNKYLLSHGKKHITEELGNYKYIVSPDSFFQVNLDVANKLYNKIKEYVGTNNNILDLYCGTGSIGIFVNENNNVVGVEINDSAVKDAFENAKLNNINNIDFLCENSEKAIKKIKTKPNIIIVDPPRSGLTNETINNIFKLDINTMIYVSCDPMTLVRDLNILSKIYKIEEITPFDMFPNTKHVECLVLLKK